MFVSNIKNIDGTVVCENDYVKFKLVNQNFIPPQNISISHKTGHPIFMRS